MGDHRAQASKNSVTAKQEVKPSLSNVQQSLSGLPENYLSKSIADSHDRPVAVSHGTGFFDFDSTPIFHRSKTPVRLNSQALPVQAKLKIGQPNDKYEQEADRVADHIMRMPDPKVQRQAESEEEEPIQTKSITPLVQRQPEPEEEEEEAVPEREEESTPILESVPTGDADELDEEETVQTKSLANKPTPVKAGLQNRIQSLKGGGQPLPGAERAFFEPRFGADFSNVRVHTNNRAADTAQSINARAFTLGHDVVFGAGQYSPRSHAGRSLLAHELTHVVQQGGSNKMGFRTPNESDPITLLLLDPIASDPNDAESHRLSGIPSGAISHIGARTSPTSTLQRAPAGAAAKSPSASPIADKIITEAYKRKRNKLLEFLYNKPYTQYGVIVPNSNWKRGIPKKTFVEALQIEKSKDPKIVADLRTYKRKAALQYSYYHARKKLREWRKKPLGTPGRVAGIRKWGERARYRRRYVFPRGSALKQFERIWDRYNLIPRKYKRSNLAEFPNNEFYIDYEMNRCNIFVFDAIWNAGRKFSLPNGHYPGPNEVSSNSHRPSGLKKILKASHVRRGDIFHKRGHVGLVAKRHSNSMFQAIEWNGVVTDKNKWAYSNYTFYRVT